MCHSPQSCFLGQALQEYKLLVITALIVIVSLQDELQSMQARAQYAESRAAVAEAELQALRKVCSNPSILAILR
jgi:cell division protein ZapA (FtsZ GTPase activity inhibitor)